MASYNVILNPTIPSTRPKQILRKKPTTTSLAAAAAAASRRPRLTITQYLTQPAEPTTTSLSQKVRALDSEFRSLPEPIDRVKRLLHYATHLPRFDESARTEENRVPGCAARVWLDVRMDRDGLMRFGVDSDSEITKGFCSRLVWLFDGAEAREVLSVGGDELAEMNVNVGFSGGASSRVNAWNSVLDAMQRRTQALLEEREKEKKKNGVERMR